MGNEFTWKKLSEGEKEKIALQAKEIMNSFSKKLERVGVLDSKFFFEGKNSFREEGSCEVSNLDKEIFLENSPKKERDFLVAEKGEWVKK
jgi:Asp-tRNA(Asn)/Glu-tRNA(Gln) amidotransferase C subunit